MRDTENYFLLSEKDALSPIPSGGAVDDNGELYYRSKVYLINAGIWLDMIEDALEAENCLETPNIGYYEVLAKYATNGKHRSMRNRFPYHKDEMLEDQKLHHPDIHNIWEEMKAFFLHIDKDIYEDNIRYAFCSMRAAELSLDSPYQS